MDTEPRAVSLVVLKGGVGKSTTSINLVRELANRGHDALLVDLDPNGHSTTSLGLGEVFYADEHIGDVLLDSGDADPSDVIVDSGYEFDVLPSNDQIEDVEQGLRDVMMGTARLRERVVEPLLGDAYDYIIVDCPASRGKLNDNALYATQNMILPLRPESGALSGLEKTVRRLIQPAREHFDLEVLAVATTDLKDRLDHDRPTRQLIEALVRRDNLRKKLPNFAYVDPAFFDAVDAGEWDDDLPKPGIRHRDVIDRALRENMPVRDLDPSCDQLECYGELAEIVETGEVVRRE
ncbi:ParA family protein (plasmid) [Salinigranum rubrum]|uniref:ParA family protein n=1 Tax=Salinigranum rubrum TaxID=755307 RepID=A0A2I8VS06_9EURY|nr:ParA family protein [Salinigranum rubrum]AUV84685.1 ParA family protein [Salinigranum rubrum]